MSDDVDPANLEKQILREADLDRFALLATHAGLLRGVGPRVLAQLVAQAGYPETRADVRAMCAWAIAEHDPMRGGWIAGALLGDPETAFWLASIVACRGGALTALVAGQHADPALDQVWSQIAVG
jgi:hypothetical protein